MIMWSLKLAPLKRDIRCELASRLKLTLVKLGNVGIVLKLEEASLHHVLGVDFLHAKQVQNHVVGQSAIN